jgi:SAM-dependent methyltransferase
VNEPATIGRRPQERTDAYFRDRSAYWSGVYSSRGVQATIYRDRQAMALGWIDQLALRPGPRALDLGCGAGFMTVALAQRGFSVDAVDSVPAMIALTRRHAAAFAASVSPSVGDACSLRFDDGMFDLVVALGLIPWLDRPELAIREMARVTRPGGHVLVTADNLLRLNHLLDPYFHPMLRPLKERLKPLLEQRGIRQTSPNAAPATFHPPRAIDKVLAEACLVKTKGHTLGFGPFTLFGRGIVPEPLGAALHTHLRHLGDRGIPILRSTGAHYLVLARKPQPLVPPMSPESRGGGPGDPAIRHPAEQE